MEKLTKSAESVKASPSGGGLKGAIKKIMGLIWMLLAPVVIFFLVKSAVHNVGSGGTKDINQPLPWIIIITIFTPIAIGLMIFGYYAMQGAYDHLPESSEEL
jgi:hypothetical protein